MDVNDLILVSVDDHIVEPGDMYEKHLTQAQKVFAPKMLKDRDGADYWLYEGRRAGATGLNAVAGRVPEEYGCEPASLQQMRSGAYDVHGRIADMNVNGILGSINFPSVVRFDGSLFYEFENKAQALTLLQAYNDWHVDEWCGAYPGRFISLGLLPLWDMAATVAEVKRLVAKGCHAVTMTDNPTTKGLPSIHNEYWEPLWKVCAENKVVICLHIGTGNAAPHASMETPIDAWITTMPMAISVGAADWIHLAALRRYPDLRVALSEGGIGWIPYLLERMNFTHQQHSPWTHADFGKGGRPSDIFHKHFITCFIDDEFGLKNLDSIGEDMVCYECDYPHSDCLWPSAPERFLQTCKGLTDAQIDKISHLNAMREFNFDPFSLLGRENCTVGALRRQAASVDTTPASYGGPSPLLKGEVRRVTSGDITRMFVETHKTGENA